MNKLNNIYFGLVILLLAACGEKSTQEIFEQGKNAYHDGDTKAAIDKFSNAIKMEKGKGNQDKKLLSNIYNLRGEVYLSLGVATLSQSDFVYALDFNPTNESALNNLGVWFSIEQFAKPDYKKSLDYFDKAIALTPARKDVVLNRAVVKIKSGDKTGCDELRKLEAEGYSDAKTALQQFCNN